MIIINRWWQRRRSILWGVVFITITIITITWWEIATITAITIIKTITQTTLATPASTIPKTTIFNKNMITNLLIRIIGIIGIATTIKIITTIIIQRRQQLNITIHVITIATTTYM